MATVADLLKSKGSQVMTIGPDATVLDAARAMNAHRIGALVVVDGAGDVIGMFTERDILTRIVAEEREPSGTRVHDVMTPRVLTCTTTTELDDLRSTMRQQRIRHVPVLCDGRLCGMVSLGDLNTAQVKVLTDTISYFEQYMYRG